MAKTIEPSRTAVEPESATVKLDTVPPATKVVSHGLVDGVHGPETELNHVAARVREYRCSVAGPLIDRSDLSGGSGGPCGTVKLNVAAEVLPELVTDAVLPRACRCGSDGDRRGRSVGPAAPVAPCGPVGLLVRRWVRSDRLALVGLRN